MTHLLINPVVSVVCVNAVVSVVCVVSDYADYRDYRSSRWTIAFKSVEIFFAPTLVGLHPADPTLKRIKWRPSEAGNFWFDR